VGVVFDGRSPEDNELPQLHDWVFEIMASICFEGSVLLVRCRHGVHQNLWLVDTDLDDWHSTLIKQFSESVSEQRLTWHLAGQLCNGVRNARHLMEERNGRFLSRY